MKILHVITNTELGGAQRVCIDLAVSALLDGNEVAVASMSGGYLWEELPDGIHKYSLESMVKEISLKKDFKCFFELKKVLKQFKPDIVHLHSSKAGVMGRIAGLFSKTKIVYTVHGFDSIRLKHRIFLPLERILQHFCSAIVPVSYYDEKNLYAEKIRKHVFIIHNGIREPVRKKELDVLSNDSLRTEKIVMSIARISPPKKIQMFVNVAKRLPKFLFVWIGGEYDCSIEETRNKYDVPDNCVLAGNVPDASSYLNECSCFVLFSNFEGLPMTIIEAMANKKPVVASDVGGICELVDKSNGKLITTEDEAVLAIREILDDENAAKEMGCNSYKKFADEFTLGAMWNKYKFLYEKLLNNREE